MIQVALAIKSGQHQAKVGRRRQGESSTAHCDLISDITSCGQGKGGSAGQETKKSREISDPGCLYTEQPLLLHLRILQTAHTGPPLALLLCLLTMYTDVIELARLPDLHTHIRLAARCCTESRAVPSRWDRIGKSKASPRGLRMESGWSTRGCSQVPWHRRSEAPAQSITSHSSIAVRPAVF